MRVQVQGKDRDLVAEMGSQLELEGTYIPRSYIEQVDLPRTSTSQAGSDSSDV